MRFELTTPTLARLYSTTELHPLCMVVQAKRYCTQNRENVNNRHPHKAGISLSLGRRECHNQICRFGQCNSALTLSDVVTGWATNALMGVADGTLAFAHIFDFRDQPVDHAKGKDSAGKNSLLLPSNRFDGDDEHMP